ncbi:MAG: anion permease [Saprospiraceae bacterium]|nr:anion permease [Saprospiraceae bacterium]
MANMNFWKSSFWYLFGGILAALLTYFLTDGLLDPAARGAISIGVLMVIWWVSEALPMPVVALVPLVAFPILKIAKTDAVAASYSNPAIYLFLEDLCSAWP